PAALEADRPGDSAQKLVKGGAALGRGILRSLYMFGPLGQRPHDAELIWDLVQEADALADELLIDLAGNGEYRRTERLRGGKRRRGVEEARARHDAVGLRSSGRQGRAEGHV